MGMHRDEDKRQRVIDALTGSAGMTINEISAAVGFDAKNVVGILEREGEILQLSGKVLDQTSRRKVYAYAIRAKTADMDAAMSGLCRA